MAQILPHPTAPFHKFVYRDSPIAIYKTGWMKAQTTIERFAIHIHHAGRCIRRLPVSEPLPLDQLETIAKQYIDGYLDQRARKQDLETVPKGIYFLGKPTSHAEITRCYSYRINASELEPEELSGAEATF